MQDKHPKADDNGLFHCAMCGKASPIAEDYNLDYFITPMCKPCFRDGMHYGWD